MNDRDPELPDLSYKIRFALQAGRRVKPGPALEQRVFRALDDVDAGVDPRRKGPARRLSIPVALVMIGGVAATAVGVICAAVYSIDTARPAPPGVTVASRDLTVQVPADGHVWVDLPFDTGRHDAETVLVSFNAPASVTLDVEDDSNGYAQECEGHRCVHRWEASSRPDDEVMPRARITEPGRYEFSVTHASVEQRFHERFVVLATR